MTRALKDESLLIIGNSITIQMESPNSTAWNEETDKNNPAPDPVLLLAKASSKWLKRQFKGIMP